MRLVLVLCVSFFAVVESYEKCHTNETGRKRSFDTGGKAWINLWPTGAVPYEFTDKVTQQVKDAFQCAVREYDRKTCIRFVPRRGESTFLTINYNPQVCGGAGGTFLEIGDSCWSGDTKCGVFIHEMGHNLGYGHEMDRYDRDDWLEGQGLGNKVNFETFCLMFDYQSIMIYPDYCTMFGGPWRPKKNNVEICGSDNVISVLDADKFNACYNCKGCLAYRWINIRCYGSQHEPVYGGYDLDWSPFYVCRAWHDGDIIPGKAQFRSGEAPYCYCGHFGNEYKLYDFEILTNPSSGGASLQWVYSSGIPQRAITGGRATDRRTFYIGRCFHQVQNQYTLLIGKIYANDPGKVIMPFGGGEVQCTSSIQYLACA